MGLRGIDCGPLLATLTFWLGIAGFLGIVETPEAMADALPSPLSQRLTPEVMAAVFPNAERLGKEEGTPRAIPVLKGTEVIGYVFSTLDVVRSPGYSSVPFDVIAGVDTRGHITGAKLIYN